MARPLVIAKRLWRGLGLLVLPWATVGGCSLLVSYDGYGDGVREGDPDADVTDVSDAGADGALEDAAADAPEDVLDAGPDGKRYLLVALGGRQYDDAGEMQRIASVEAAELLADGSLGPWSETTAMPFAEDFVGCAVHGTSVFVDHASGTYVASTTADGGLTPWATLPKVARIESRLAATDTHLYLASGMVGSPVVPEVYYAPITGPQAIGPWALTSPLPDVVGPRKDSTFLTRGTTLYLVGGEQDGSALTDSVLYARAGADGALGAWEPTSPLPVPADHVRAVIVRDRVIALGGIFSGILNETVYSAQIEAGGGLGAWQLGANHPARSEPGFAAYRERVYLVGGRNSATPLTTVITAPVGPAGFPGSWQGVEALKVPRYRSRVVVVEMP